MKNEDGMTSVSPYNQLNNDTIENVSIYYKWTQMHMNNVYNVLLAFNYTSEIASSTTVPAALVDRNVQHALAPQTEKYIASHWIL